MKRTIRSLLFLFIVANLGLAEETSFGHVKVPDLKGRQTKAVLVFSDTDKAVEVHPAKGNPVTIPYGEIDKCSYEFTKKHRISEGTMMMAPVGVGAVAMLTKSKSHWLEIDYHQQEAPRILVLRMDKHEYIQILEALKTHTGKDAEILGNANKLEKN